MSQDNASAVSKDQQHSSPLSCAEILGTLIATIEDNVSTCEKVKNSLQLICGYSKSIPYVGLALTAVSGILSDEDSEVSRSLKKLGTQIKKVRQDVAELENKIKWEAVELQYCDIVTKIQTGVQFLEISESTNDERRNFEEKLKELCSNQAMTLAVQSLLEGLNGEGLRQNDVLETIYRVTKGHRRQSESMCKRFMELFTRGLSVISAYETLLRGEEAALGMITFFKGAMEKLKTRFEALQKKCKDNFKDNMLVDLNEVLDSKRSNEDAVAYLSKFMREKYDWLENYCIICNQTTHMDCFFEGDYVSSFGRNGRFGVVFFHEATEVAVDEATQRDVNVNLRNFVKIAKAAFRSAKKMCQKLKGNFSRDVVSCAVIKPREVLLLIPVYNAVEIRKYGATMETLQQKGTSSTVTRFPRSPAYTSFYLVLWK